MNTNSRDHEKDVQPALPISTDASSSDREVEPSPSSSTFSPQSSETPPAKKKATYEDLGLTPTKMSPIELVIEKMRQDGADHLAAGEHDCIIYRLIVFLYEKGYYDDLSREDRIARVKPCISKTGGNRKRLRDLAFPHYSHRMPFSDAGFEIYFQMASTARMIFERENATGGFPVAPYYRVQDSANCYTVATCMFLTIKLQRDYPKLQQQPVDVGYIGGRHVIETREKLEKRVLHHKGGDAVTLCRDVIGEDCWERVNCNFSNPNRWPEMQKTQQNLAEYLEKYGVGLVSEFCTHDEFKVCSKKPETRYGYWKFEGNSIDCEGQFVPIEADSKIESERQRLRGIWQDQLQDAKDAKKRNNVKAADVLKASPRNDQNHSTDRAEEATESKESNDHVQPSGGTHAMVMLGTCKDDDGKTFYVVWNWWVNMTLIMMSFEYLIACQCRVFFWDTKLNVEYFPVIERNRALACDCGFPDHAENTSFKLSNGTEDT